MTLLRSFTLFCHFNRFLPIVSMAPLNFVVSCLIVHYNLPLIRKYSVSFRGSIVSKILMNVDVDTGMVMGMDIDSYLYTILLGPCHISN